MVTGRTLPPAILVHSHLLDLIPHIVAARRLLEAERHIREQLRVRPRDYRVLYTPNSGMNSEVESQSV